MRRNRNLREHRSKLLSRRKVLSVSERRELLNKDILKNKKRKHRTVIYNLPPAEDPTPDPSESRRIKTVEERRRDRRAKTMRPSVKNDKNLPAAKPSGFSGFKEFDDYCYSSRPVRVAHVIESLGLGGAQTMMLELAGAMQSYYSEHVEANFIICLHKKNQKPIKKLYNSYGFNPLSINYDGFGTFLSKHKVDVVIHHRISASSCLKPDLPPGVKYILVNHTWHNLSSMRNFRWCDFYISVCNFLYKKTLFPSFVHHSRKLVILNGVENNYLDDIAPYQLPQVFKTGRCHRMVPGKFRVDSLAEINNWAKNRRKFCHVLLGHHSKAKLMAKKYPWLRYFGSVPDRRKKMSIIKHLDAYYYDTYQEEGASVAVLESLACGVPVLCKNRGGNSELIKNKVNGFILSSSSAMLSKVSQLMDNPDMLAKLKQSTIDDFNNRLHVKNTACKYMQVIEHLIGGG